MSSIIKKRVAVLLLAAAMVWFAYALGRGVFLVPVVPALVYRYFLLDGEDGFSRPEFAIITGLSSIIGVLVANYGAGNLTIDLLVAYLSVSLQLTIGKSRVFEAYAVALLPVFLLRDGFRYKDVVLFYLLLTLFVQERIVKSRRVFEGGRPGLGMSEAFKRYALQAVLMLPLFAVEFVLDNCFLLLPCLFYAFALLCEEGGNGFKIESEQPDYLCLQVFTAVLAGALADMAVMTMLPTFGLSDTGPLTATVYAAAAVAVLGFLMLAFSRKVFPPVLGMAMFPFLRDGDVCYVFAVDAVFVYMLVASMAYRCILLKINRAK